MVLKNAFKQKGKNTPKANYLAMSPVLDLKKLCMYRNTHTQQLKYTYVHISYMIYSNNKIIGYNQIFLNYFSFLNRVYVLVDIHVCNHP